MKKLILFVALFTSILSYGQTSLPSAPAPNRYIAPFELTGQLLNLSNTNASPILDTVTTSSSAATLSLTTGKYSTVTGLPLIYPLTGSGPLGFTVGVTKISGTVTGFVVLQASINGSQWGPVHDGTILSSDTLQLTNVAGTQTYALSVPRKNFAYYRLLLSLPSSTQSVSVSGFYDFNKTFIYGN